MADLISDDVKAPDLGQIEQGNFIATADAVLLLYRQIRTEHATREQQVAVITADTSNDWIRINGGLY